MAVFAVYIEKATEYHGVVDDVFGNTYHFNVDPATEIDDEAVALAVASAESNVMLDYVSFRRWTTWGPTDGPMVDNVMRDSGGLNNVGIGTTPEGFYREVAALVVWPMPRSVPLNRRRWLRKFLRGGTGGSFSNLDIAAGVAPLPTVNRDALAQYASTIRNLQVGGQDHLLSNAQGEIANAPGFARPYLITRQIGR